MFIRMSEQKVIEDGTVPYDGPSLVEKPEKEIDELEVSEREYRPTSVQSRMLCEITRDINPVHQEHLSPAFLQFSRAYLHLINEIQEVGLNPEDYLVFTSTVQMSGFILNDSPIPYEFNVDLDTTNEETLNSSVVIPDPKKPKKTLYSLETVMYHHSSNMNLTKFFERIAFAPYVHRDAFPLDQAFSFSRIIGSDEEKESLLYAIASSSSVVGDAIKKGILTIDIGDVIPVYDSQRLYVDRMYLDPSKEEITLELYISYANSFGVKRGRGKELDMTIVARDDRENIIYLSNSPLKFMKRAFLERFCKRARSKYSK